MGQGTDSAGGYELDYDWWHESELWAGRYKVSEMTVTHLKNAIRVCSNMSKSCTFTSDQEVYEEWGDILKDELIGRPKSVKQPEKAKPALPIRGSKIELVCHCGEPYQARVADLKRGWGKSCCKRCASIKREFGRPNPRTKDGRDIKTALNDFKL